MSLFVVAACLLSVCSVASTTPTMDSRSAAKTFNAMFTGRGVVMRGTSDLRIWCHDDCFRGGSDCRVSAGLFNLDIGVKQPESVFVGSFFGSPFFGVVFNLTMVETELARCYFALNGGSVFRYNGGCACQAPPRDRSCSSPYSPFRNIAPDGKPVNGASPWAERCRCQSLATSNYSCFWRGPAYDTGKGDFNSSELSTMLRQDVAQFAENPHNWNELVLDGGRLKDVLAKDPASAVLGIFFSGNDTLSQALSLQTWILNHHRIRLPLVGVSRTTRVSKTRGPFFEYPPVDEIAVV